MPLKLDKFLSVMDRSAQITHSDMELNYLGGHGYTAKTGESRAMSGILCGYMKRGNTALAVRASVGAHPVAGTSGAFVRSVSLTGSLYVEKGAPSFYSDLLTTVYLDDVKVAFAKSEKELCPRKAAWTRYLPGM